MILRTLFLSIFLLNQAFAGGEGTSLVDDSVVHSLSFKKPEKEELNGNAIASHFLQIELNVPGLEEMFKGKTLRQVSDCLKEQIESGNIITAILFLHLMTAEWIELDMVGFEKARKVIESNRNEKFIFAKPYLFYFIQVLSFKNLSPPVLDWFSPDKFEMSFLLCRSFQYGSLVMQVFGGLHHILRDIQEEQIDPLYFASKPHSGCLSRPHEVLILAHALLLEEGLLPLSYRPLFLELLRQIEGQLNSIFKKTHLYLPHQNGSELEETQFASFFNQIKEYVEEWLKICPRPVPPLSPENGKNKPSSPSGKKKKKTVSWAENVEERSQEEKFQDHPGNVPKARARELTHEQRSLWYKLITSFRGKTSLKETLWLYSLSSRGFNFGELLWKNFKKPTAK